MSSMIIRVKASKAVERILKRPDEDPEDSPLEFLDQRMEEGKLGNVSYEIPDETQEKDLAKQKSHDKVIEHTAQKQTVVFKGEQYYHGKSNDSGLERH